VINVTVRLVFFLYTSKREFSQNQRGAYGDNRYIGEQRYPKRWRYSSSTKKILAVILPITGFLVLSGIGTLVFLYYRKFRQEQYRTRRPAGAMRLQDNYASKSFTHDISTRIIHIACKNSPFFLSSRFFSALPQDMPNEKAMFSQYEQTQANNQA
jgi:hypothetical protein